MSVAGQRLNAVSRRAKYLLLELERGTLILHLGMSGRLCLVSENTPPQRHDHVDFVFEDHSVLRLNDPRRFGSIHWQPMGSVNRLIANLGPEPLSSDFNADYLITTANKRKTAIKNLIMDSHVVAGVGNIYANEALFRSGIRPRRGCGRITRAEADALVSAIKETLADALKAGGTTLRDFQSVDGTRGYFRVSLQVYGREGLPCTKCKTPIKRVSSDSRQTVYCPKCQR